MDDEFLKYGVIGSPISHSRSPQMFNELFRQNDINAHYTRILNPDVRMMNRLSLDGFNITSPFKSSFAMFIDKELEFQSPIKIVNAVRIAEDKAQCYNFDIIALEEYIKDKIGKIKTALILGSGDTAYTSAYVLKKFRINTELAARNMQKGKQLCDEYDLKYQNISSVSGNYDLIISTIPIDASYRIIEKISPEFLISADYATDYRYSKNHFTGIDWLIAQAKPFYRKLTGIRANNDLMLKAVNSEKSKSIIHLTGFMGSGKTAIGRELAHELGRKFIDSDELIVNKENMNIKDIFAQKGEDYFRRIEAEIIDDSLMNDNIILSTGGGALQNDTTFTILNDVAYNIYLSAEYDVMFERSYSNFRPLRHNDRKSFIDLFESRENKYYKISDLIVNSDIDVTSCVKMIANDINRSK